MPVEVLEHQSNRRAARADLIIDADFGWFVTSRIDEHLLVRSIKVDISIPLTDCTTTATTPTFPPDRQPTSTPPCSVVPTQHKVDYTHTYGHDASLSSQTDSNCVYVPVKSGNWSASLQFLLAATHFWIYTHTHAISSTGSDTGLLGCALRSTFSATVPMPQSDAQSQPQRRRVSHP